MDGNSIYRKILRLITVNYFIYSLNKGSGYIYITLVTKKWYWNVGLSVKWWRILIFSSCLKCFFRIKASDPF